MAERSVAACANFHTSIAATPDATRSRTCGWVGWFNEERFHSELDDLTPAEVEAAYYLQQSQPDAA